MAQIHEHQRPVQEEKFIKDVSSKLEREFEKELAGVAVKIDRFIIETIADELYKKNPDSKQIVSLLNKTKTGAPRYYNIITGVAERDPYADNVIKNSYRTEGRRHFLKIGAGATALGVIGLTGATAYLNAIATPPVVPPVTTTTTSDIKPSSINEVRQAILDANSNFKHPFGMNAYLRQIEHLLIGAYAGGDTSVYAGDVKDSINRLWQHQYKIYQDKTRRLSFDPEAMPFSDPTVQLNNLGQSLLSRTVCDTDAKTGEWKAFENKKDYITKFLIPNIDLLPELYEETHQILDDKSLYDGGITQFMEEEVGLRAMSPSLSYFPQIGEWRKNYFEQIVRNGGVLEKDPIAIKGYIRDSTHGQDDLSRRIALAHLWSVGAPAYDASADVPYSDANNTIQYINDGFLGTPMGDERLRKKPEGQHVKETQATGIWFAPQRLLETEKYRGAGLKNVQIEMPPSGEYQVIYMG